MIASRQPFSSSPLIFEASRFSHDSPRVLYTSNRGAEGDAGFNMGYHVPDDPERVRARRHQVQVLLKRPVAVLKQVHSSRVIDLDDVLSGIPEVMPEGLPGGITDGDEKNAAALASALEPLGETEADAQVTTRRDIAVGILTADCTPVLLADAYAGVFAGAHAGRRGVENHVVAETIAVMKAKGADPARMEVWLGPNICGDCYETGDEVSQAFAEACPVPGAATRTRFGGAGVDMRAVLRSQLMEAGVAEGNLHDDDASIGEQSMKGQSTKSQRAEQPATSTVNYMCTLENPQLYSYREWTLTHRPGSNGRFLSILVPPSRKETA
ncbi:MAG: polyphenol oxidase family protein [Bifidobacteriaceae bacterium]|jgi:YfiH family protein|nr:polyphenol oxidase family protein [Bifidobacteriaceae bacterium]MCI1978726.1 polyphenol oxidase family protein [Bifidobacteriaceae bacterium]